MTEFEFTDRYEAAGVPYPDPETMCKGQCDGMGCYPQKLDDPDITAEERRRWQAKHDDGAQHEGGACDGYHFITCPDCEGTGKRQ